MVPGRQEHLVNGWPCVRIHFSGLHFLQGPSLGWGGGGILAILRPLPAGEFYVNPPSFPLPCQVFSSWFTWLSTSTSSS